MNKAIFFMTVLLSTSLVACGGDDNNVNNSGGFDLGEISVTVSGDMEGNFSGMADFDHLATGNIETWEISGHDYDPQSFSISFMDMVIGGSAERPLPGTHSIGGVLADYTAGFEYFPDPGNYFEYIEYSTIFGSNPTSGTLTVTSSNENTVKGSFEFTAYRVDDNLNIVGTVQVSGEFTANKRIN